MNLSVLYDWWLGKWQLIGILAVVLTALSVWQALGVEADSDMERIVGDGSATQQAISEFNRAFGGDLRDEVLRVQTDNLGGDDAFNSLRDLVFELQLLDEADAVISLFALPGSAGDPFLSDPEIRDLPTEERLNRLYQDMPSARGILSEDLRQTLIFVSPRTDISSLELRIAMEQAISFAEPAFKPEFVGMTAVNLEITSALIADQKVLIPSAVLLCFFGSLILFRSWSAALICAVPPVVALLWFLGYLGATGTRIDPFMTTVPTVIIVLGFADCIHLFYAIAGSNADDRLKAGFSETVWPAFMASLTTALAFLAIAGVGSPALEDMAVGGIIGMALSFLAFAAVFPAAYRILPHGTKPRAFSFVTRRITTSASSARWVVLAGAVLLAAFVGLQTRTAIGFEMTEFLPRGSSMSQMLAEMNGADMGSSVIYAVVGDPDGTPGVSDSDQVVLSNAAQVVYGGMGSAFSFADAQEAGRLIAQDGLSYALPIPVSLSETPEEMNGRLEGIRERWQEAGLAGLPEFVGQSLVLSTDMPEMIQDLRRFFYIGLFGIALVILISMRSLSQTLAVVLASLIPILGVEAWLVLTGQSFSMTSAVAMTLAFGIAVDDSLHLMNRYRLAQAAGAPNPVDEAVRAAAAPMTATTILLLIGFATTLFSSLPNIATFGALVSSALALALLADLLLLPAALKVRLK